MRLDRMFSLRHVAFSVVIVLAYPGATALGADADYGGYRPHYQGYGVNTPGGRGGTVRRVTNLNDSGSGSLRAAVTAPGARFVIFDLSGTIQLNTPLVVTQPHVTIAGQTAPSPGITLRGPGLIIDTHDVVVQHLRVRVGAVPNMPHALWIRDDANKIVIDHVSLSWSVWTSLALTAVTGGHPVGEVTVMDSLVAEALACTGTITQPIAPCDPAIYPAAGYSNSRALLIGGEFWGHTPPKATFLRNISANNNDRHPEIGGGTDSFLINNLIYNPSLTPHAGVFYQDAARNGALRSVVVGNVLIPGPTTPGHNNYRPPEFASDGDVYMIRVHQGTHAGSRIYLDGNYYAKHCGGAACLASPTAQWQLAWEGINVRATTPPVTLANLPLSSAMPYTAVEAYVKANAGARPLDRDVVDIRIINEITSRNGRVPNHTSEKAGPGTGADGFPVLAQNQRALVLPVNPNDVVDAVGRTRIEAWLEGLARALEPNVPSGGPTIGPAAPRNLRQLPN